MKKKIIRIILLLILPVILTGHLTAAKAAGPEVLADVLENTAQYCETLKKNVFHFFCSEEVHEVIHKSLEYPEARRGLKNFLSGIKTNQTRSEYVSHQSLRDRRMRMHYGSQKKEIINIYLSDYQIIQTSANLKERRVLRKINGWKPEGKIPRLQTLIYSYKNVLSPARFFARENQADYTYRLLKQERVMGRKAHVIEVKEKKSGPEDGFLVTAWVDVEDHSILKFQVFPAAFGGADYLMRSGGGEKYNLRINDVHYFGKLRNGVRYPSKTEISISYNEEPKKQVVTRNRRLSHGARIFTKLSTTYSYKDYIFHNVTVEDPVFH